MAGLVAKAAVEVDADAARVWRTMTDPDLVAQHMMGSRVESDYRPGSPITWSGVWEGRPYQDKGEVIEAVPGRVLEVTHYSPLGGDDDVPENYHRVRYELEPNGSGTTVRLTQDGCQSPEQAEQFSRTWQAMLEGLKQVAEQD